MPSRHGLEALDRHAQFALPPHPLPGSVTTAPVNPPIWHLLQQHPWAEVWG